MKNFSILKFFLVNYILIAITFYASQYYRISDITRIDQKFEVFHSIKLPAARSYNDKIVLNSKKKSSGNNKKIDITKLTERHSMKI